MGLSPSPGLKQQIGNDFRRKRSGKCLFNSLAYNCDFQDAIGAANEAYYWGSSGPGKRKRSGDSLSFEKSSPFLKPSRADKKNYLMRVGKRSAEVDLEGNERPDHGFLIRIGRSQQIPRQSLYSRKRADKTYLIRVGRSVGPPTNLIREGRSVGPPTNLKRVGRSVGPPTNQDKRQKSGSNAFFLTRV